MPQEFGREIEKLGEVGKTLKRHGNLFEKLCSIENLELAHKNAKKGKSKYAAVRQVEINPAPYLENIRNMLLNKSFTTSKYLIFEKQCGDKVRKLHKLPYYPDRIVQHALMQIIEPILVPTFIRNTFQSLKGRGTHDARKRFRKSLRSDRSLKCFLKFDINKFYPSIDNIILKQLIRRKIKCADTLWLIDDIIDSTEGLPIGNYSSQIFGNLYLSGLDHYAKEVLGLKHYFRYCDDIVVLHSDIKYLHKIKYSLFDYTKTLNLAVKNTWQVNYLPVNFVSWKFDTSSTNVKNKTKVSLLGTASELCLSGVMSYWGIFKPSSNQNYWIRIVGDRYDCIFRSATRNFSSTG